MTNTKRRYAGIASIALAIALVATGAEAQRGERRRERRDDNRDAVVEARTGWDKLGERTVGSGVDHDTILVTAIEGRFTRAMITVERSTLELYDVVFTFGDGTTFSPPTRLVFTPGESTRVIDLPGGARVIRRVDFRVANQPGGGPAQFELWAR